MNNYYQKLCLVNPHLFDSSKVINQHFRSALLGKEYPEYESITIFDLSDWKHQRMFRFALETHTESLNFILQNGIVYTYLEFDKMLSNGELQKITGGMTSVDLGSVTSSEEYSYQKHPPQSQEFPYNPADCFAVLSNQVFSVGHSMP
jgi:hypothetical protein